MNNINLTLRHRAAAGLLALPLVLSFPSTVDAQSLLPENPKRPAVDPSLAAPLKELSNAFSSVANSASPAVVYITAERKQAQVLLNTNPGTSNQFYYFDNNLGQPQNLRDLFDQQGSGSTPNGNGFFRIEPFEQRAPLPRRVSQGSGFIINATNGYILTNNHVVENAEDIRVHLSDRRVVDATVLGSDKAGDVALLQINADNLHEVALGDESKLSVGEWIVAVGSPFGLQHSVTAGIVSAVGRGQVGILEFEEFIQTDAAINPGNSGGPLLNLAGEVVGMNTAIATRSQGYEGVGFAIPISTVRRIAEQLLANGEVRRSMLGVVIQEIDDDLAAQFGVSARQNVLISDVQDGTPAFAAGLQEGDVITKLNGHQVTAVDRFRNEISLITPGTQVNLTIVRDGQEEEVPVTLAERPSDGNANAGLRSAAQTPAKKVEPFRADTLGFSVQELTERAATSLNMVGQKGVVISEVDSGSEAEREGLEAGQVITRVGNNPVETVEEFTEAIADHSADIVLLQVRTARGKRFVTLSTK